MDGQLSRRQLLTTTATTTAAILAGCSTNDSSPGEETTTETPHDESEDEDTLRPSIDGVTLEAAKFVPVVNEESRQLESTVLVELDDESGVESVTLSIKDGDEYTKLPEDRPEGTNRRLPIPIKSWRFPLDDEITFKVEATDTKGNTSQRVFWKDWEEVEWENNPKKGYGLDPKQDFSKYETERNWDNSQFKQERIDQKRNEWQKAAEYDGFVEQVRNGSSDLDIEFGSYEYPGNSKTLDVKEFNSETTFQGIISWLQPAAVMRTYDEHGGPPSGHANRMAASIERALREMRDVEARGWGVYNPGHGTMMFYTEDSSAEHRWYHLDTTAMIINRPENAQEHRRDIWSPFRDPDADQPGFHEGFEVDEVDGVNTYEQAKVTSTFVLTSMVLSGEPLNWAAQDTETDGRIFTNDEWLESANEHIREDGKIEPILEPIEEMIEYRTREDTYIGIYGTGLDNTRIAVGEDLGEVYQQTMEEPGNVTATEIENMLEGQAAA